jgi:ATPase subunit of ABC transporter with duplicated ATPase domains
MAQLVPIATALGAGATVFSTVRQAQTQSANAKAQAAAAQQQEAARQQQLAAQQAAEARAREARLEGTTASARARLAASGVSPDEGSSAALAAGLERDAAAAQADSDHLFAARLASGRRSLLNNDGSLTTWLRAGSSFGTSLRNLLD